jgi:hypothetical protein
MIFKKFLQIAASKKLKGPETAAFEGDRQALFAKQNRFVRPRLRENARGVR